MGETIEAGGLKFFVEDRTVGEDGGPSMQVLATIEGKEVQLLRFDMFHKGPHYHYDPNGTNLRYDLDPLVLEGDGVHWTMKFFGDNLSRVLAKTGYEKALARIDRGDVFLELPVIEHAWKAQSPASRPLNTA